MERASCSSYSLQSGAPRLCALGATSSLAIRALSLLDQGKELKVLERHCRFGARRLTDCADDGSIRVIVAAQLPLAFGFEPAARRCRLVPAHTGSVTPETCLPFSGISRIYAEVAVR